MAILNSNGYKLHFGNNALNALNDFLKKRKFSRYFILCDENSLQHCLPHLVVACPEMGKGDIIEVESGEANKTLDTCQNIWEIFTEQEADKSTLLVNLGGGVIGDIGGFSASVFKRGIPFIHIPTTLLAMADACLGGKNGIDFMGLKNNIGLISTPEAVFVCPPFLNTLDEAQVLNGWVEVFKIALVSDKKLWKDLEKLGRIPDPSGFILKALQLKNKIVLQDPNDVGKRKVLNFGHSIGHAIEALFLDQDVELMHGAAVCSGMILESHIALQKKMISTSVYKEICQRLEDTFQPMQKIPFKSSELLSKLRQDKKNKGGKLYFALPSGIGSCKPVVEVNDKQIQKALEAYSKR